jgi:probable regulatory domain-containing protein
MSVPLKFIGKEDIGKLESALLVMSLYSAETLEALKNVHERLTWIDSLYVASASLAREKAGIPVSKIAEELGITEATVRRHLKGETKAGQMILKAYEKLAKEGFKVDLPEIIKVQNNEVEKLKQKLDTIKQIIQDILKEL